MNESIESMKILVTGNTGFLGSALASHLASQGAQIETLEGERPGRVDITDAGAVRDALEGREIDLVVHLAGYAFVQRASPTEFYRVNILGTENILNAVIDLGIAKKGLICASTAGVYGQQPVAQLSEDMTPIPLNHYSISKLGMEFVLRKYQADRSIMMIRPFNIIGPGQNSLFLMPKLVKHFVEKQSRIEMGNLDSIRDYMSVEDFCMILGQLCAEAIRSEVVNIGTGTGSTVRDALDILTRISDHQIEVVQTTQHVRKDDIHSLVSDPAKLLSLVELPSGFKSLEQVLGQMYAEALDEGEKNAV